ncbi:MAG: ABC transporter substrate-binding protein, partial [Alphaproteobacteria bacterium]|nr:ABC transporter substrate-binding protein [Alphaproteobacteria bacterium]
MLTARMALFGLTALASASLFAPQSQAADPVRIAFIDPLTGPFATTGESGLRTFEHAVETLVNAEGGVLGGRPFEIVPMDNQISPKESLIKLKRAIS